LAWRMQIDCLEHLLS